MKIRILDRILVAFAGLIMIAACVGLVSQVFFGADVIGFLTKQATRESTAARIVIGLIAALLLALGGYCVMLLFRHRSRKDNFILQKMESGDLAISLTTLEKMVQKCLDQHPEIKAENIQLENEKDGVLIRIHGTIAGGISIPLTVDILQKQIKQYVTACSGVEVRGVRVQVEASGEDAKDAPFAIEAPTNSLLPKGDAENAGDGEAAGEDTTAEGAGPAEETETPAETSGDGEAAAAAAAMAAAESLKNEIETEDDRPLHQRLFSNPEEPCIMPLPPEELAQSAENAADMAEAAPKEEAAGAEESGSVTPEESEKKADAEPEGTAADEFRPEEKGEDNA